MIFQLRPDSARFQARHVATVDAAREKFAAGPLPRVSACHSGQTTYGASQPSQRVYFQILS